MGKFLLGFILALLLAGALGGAYILGKNQQASEPSTNVQITLPPEHMPNNTTSEEITVAGTVTGKLCYPSEMIPPGQIEAKRVGDGTVFMQEYKGSQSGGGTTYSFDLEEGIYNLRFGPMVDGKTSSYGYHTTVCLTGMETTCGDTNPRQLVPATVVAGQTVVGFDLCDFYYQPQNAPVF